MGHRAIVLTAGAAPNGEASGYVLHVVPANGGGVDRYVRDICAHRSQDCILHVVQAQCVFEAVAAQRFIPIDHQWMSEPNVVAALGRPALLHAHSTLPPVRDQVAMLSSALGVEYVVTLHDIEFADAFGVVDDYERKARLDFVSKAAQRVVPSAFISALLSSALGVGTRRECIENGVDAALSGSEPLGVATALGSFQIAVVGALGLHKGLNFLQEVIAVLPPDVRAVIIGYADGQITPGWLQKDRLWVHGAFDPRDLAGVIRAYGARIALFPNRQPESFSYALSDVWCAGLPALGPATGAIGERIAQTGAGWTYVANSASGGVAAMLLDCIAGAHLLTGSVYDAAANLLSTRDMVERLNGQYEQHEKIMATPQSNHLKALRNPQLQALETVAASHLNGHFFRSEITKLSGDLAFAHTQVANTNRALQSLTQEYEARGAWIATLERSLVECQAEIVRVEAARIAEHEQMQAARITDLAQAETARANDRELLEAFREQALTELRAQAETARVMAHTAHEKYAAKLQQDITDTLAVAHHQQRALAFIPPLLRRWMLSRAKRATSLKAAQ